MAAAAWGCWFVLSPLWVTWAYGCILGYFGRSCTLKPMQLDFEPLELVVFSDDPVHGVLGLRGSKFQSHYHFTVGGPVLDKRIMSLPAYPGPSIAA